VPLRSDDQLWHAAHDKSHDGEEDDTGGDDVEREDHTGMIGSGLRSGRGPLLI